MNNNIRKELDDIKKIIVELSKKIELLESLMNEEGESLFSNVIKDEKVLEEFKKYLTNVKRLKAGSINDYCGELRKIKTKLKELENIDIPYEIYEISDLKIVKKIQQIFRENGDLIQINLSSHHSLSAAINNYVNFLEYKRSDFVFDDEE